MLNERLSLSFRHATYNLRGGFLVRPHIIALALGCAGAPLSTLDETVPGLSAWVPMAQVMLAPSCSTFVRSTGS